MRRLAAIVALSAAAAAACARQGFPPGGPPRSIPPHIDSIVPESGAVNVKAKTVDIRFDEVVSERPASAQSIADLVLLSPRDGIPRVGWHRTHIDIRGQKGWKPNTAYTVTLRAGMVDLHGNVMKNTTVIVFSTGPTIPQTIIHGVVFDWATGRPVPNALIQVFLPPDSTQYITIGDSTGRFSLATLPAGAVTVQGVADANNNRALDPREAWDTVTVQLKDSASVELYAYVRDSLGPRISALDVRDSLTLHVTFDKPILPADSVDTANFTLRSATDSVIVPIRFVRGWLAFDKARTDSIARADSLGGKIDTAAARRKAAAARAAQLGASLDTTPKLPLPVATRALPLSEFAVVLGTPLTPGLYYRLESRHLRNLIGLGDTATSIRSVLMPKPPPPKPATMKPGALPAVPLDTMRPVVKPPHA